MSQNKEIISLYKANDILACPCGGKTYYALMDGRIECRSCGKIDGNVVWSIKSEVENADMTNMVPFDAR